VIPGGMYGHLNVARLPPGYPQFFAHTEADIDRALQATDGAMATLVKQFGRD
jgi:glutamate-1-semialdehyde 2,1-aminomutase